MEYDPSDSSGTDDDLPPPHRNRFARNIRVAGNGRSSVAGSVPYNHAHNDMDREIHFIEQEAYCSLLRAFKAQSDAITWEKESLITELRKELRVSDEEHRELLSRVNSDDMIRRIREWRKGNVLQPGILSSSQPVHESMPSPTVSALRKKQKKSQAATSFSVAAPSPVQPSSSLLKQGPPQGGRGKKTKSSVQYPSSTPLGRPQAPNRSASGAFVASEPNEVANVNPLVGRIVWTRWPEDNSFYKAVIKDFNKGMYNLGYDINTPNEAWEWVNLEEISPKDIRWEGEDPGIFQRDGRTGKGRGFKKPSGRGGAVVSAGRGRGTLKGGQAKKELLMPENGIGRKGFGDIKLLHTDTLIKEVEKVFSANHPDPVEAEKAKRVLKEHEQALVEAIARLQEASDGESDEGGRPLLQGHPMGRDQGFRKRMYDDMSRECPDTDKARFTDTDKARFTSERQPEA